MASSIPKQVRTLLCERIHAIEQLEILLLLHADRAETWTAQACAAAVHIDPSDAAAALEHLRACGLLHVVGPRGESFRYQPADRTLDLSVRDTAVVYSHSKLEVLKLISQHAMDRIRVAHVHAFASAFLVRDRNKKG